MQRIWLVPGLLALAILVGCAGGGGGYGRNINDPTNSLVFGYVDMSDAPTKINSATLQQVAPPSDKPFWHTNANNGLFHIAYMPQGSFQLATLRGSGFWSGDVRYNFPRQGKETAVRITKPGIYFLGSFKYKKVRTGAFEGGKFEIERVDSPTEAELLQKILDDDKEIKGSAWEEKIRRRLSEFR